MTNRNAIISKADVRFFPEISASQIELTLDYANGKTLFRMPMDSNSMYAILNMFNTESIHDLKGQYCRMLMDDNTGRIDSIQNIIYDNCGTISDDPVA